MKTYTKPSMQVLSLSANDPLCLGCAYPTRGSAISIDLENFYGNFDDVPGFFSREDAIAAQLFSELDSCINTMEVYCKMDAAQNIFTS